MPFIQDKNYHWMVFMRTAKHMYWCITRKWQVQCHRLAMMRDKKTAAPAKGAARFLYHEPISGRKGGFTLCAFAKMQLRIQRKPNEQHVRHKDVMLHYSISSVNYVVMCITDQTAWLMAPHQFQRSFIVQCKHATLWYFLHQGNPIWTPLLS